MRKSVPTKKKNKKKTRVRGRLKPMRVSSGFRDFVLDQLQEVKELRAKAMFGGVGLYSGDLFFGILAADVLYFKVGDTNRAEYERAGSRPFQPYAGRTMAMGYYNVPVATLEDPVALAGWAARSIAVARAALLRTPV